MSFFSDLLNPDILFTRMETAGHIYENERMTENTCREIRANRAYKEYVSSNDSYGSGNYYVRKSGKTHGTVIREGNKLILCTDEGLELWDDVKKCGTGIPCDTYGNVIIGNPYVEEMGDDPDVFINEGVVEPVKVPDPQKNNVDHQKQLEKLLKNSNQDTINLLIKAFEKEGYKIQKPGKVQEQQPFATVQTPKVPSQEDLDVALAKVKSGKK